MPEVQLRHRLRIAREHAGYEQEELAEKMGVSRNTITNYEKGKVAPRKIVLNAWAWHCGVSLDWINTGNPPAAPPDPDGGVETQLPERQKRNGTTGLRIIRAKDAA